MVNFCSLWQSLPKLHHTLRGRKNQEKLSKSTYGHRNLRRDTACGCSKEVSGRSPPYLECFHYEKPALECQSRECTLELASGRSSQRTSILKHQDDFAPLMSTSCSSTTSSRSNIRTNPWVSPIPVVGRQMDTLQMWPEDHQTVMPLKMEEGKPLDGSERSSGYGSHDSSPSCSVHSPEWVQVRKTKDVALQCSMTEDKSMACCEADFATEEEEEEDDDDDEDVKEKSCYWMQDAVENERQHWRVFGRPWCTDDNAKTFGIIQELNEKLIRVKIESEALSAVVDRIRREHLQWQWTTMPSAFAKMASAQERRYPLQPIKFTMTTFEVTL